MIRSTFIYAVLALCVVATASVAQHPTDDLSRRLRVQQETLRQLQSDLSQASTEAKQIRRKENTAARRVLSARNRLGMTEHAIATLSHSIKSLNADIRRTTVYKDSLSAGITERRTIMERRVRLLYTRGRRQPYQRALLASSLLHWFAARQYMTTLNRRDKIDVDHLSDDRERQTGTLALYQRQKETMDTLLIRRQHHRKGLLTTRANAGNHLRKVRRSRKLAERATAELAVQQDESRGRIERYLTELTLAGSHAISRPDLGTASSMTGDFKEYRGRLPWPVRGEVLTRFGRRRDRVTRTWTRSRGIDIRTPKGSHVAAVAGGEVVMVSWMRGYGTFVILSHGGSYYTLYAHLREVKVRKTDQVRQGQAVGKSGDDALGEPRVHFQLLTGKTAIDPLKWLIPQSDGPS